MAFFQNKEKKSHRSLDHCIDSLAVSGCDYPVLSSLYHPLSTSLLDTQSGSEKLVLFSSPLWQSNTALGLSVENFDGLPTNYS